MQVCVKVAEHEILDCGIGVQEPVPPPGRQKITEKE